MATEFRISIPSDDLVVVSILGMMIGHAVGEFTWSDEAEGLGSFGYEIVQVKD